MWVSVVLVAVMGAYVVGTAGLAFLLQLFAWRRQARMRDRTAASRATTVLVRRPLAEALADEDGLYVIDLAAARRARTATPSVQRAGAVQVGVR
jgi:hypothetical protein